jgi:hypothetical protein
MAYSKSQGLRIWETNQYEAKGLRIQRIAGVSPGVRTPESLEFQCPGREGGGECIQLQERDA